MTGRPPNLTRAGMARLREVYLQRQAIGAIPSNRELTRQLGVAYPTLRRAFERIRLELRAEADRVEREARQRAWQQRTETARAGAPVGRSADDSAHPLGECP